MYSRLAILLLSVLALQTSLESQLPQKSPHTLSGEALNPLVQSESKAIVLIFLASDCPISNRYAPLVNRIYEAYKEKGVEFYGVYPMSSETIEGIKTHRNDYGYQFPSLIDKYHVLVDLAEANVTPEASVYLPENDTWAYRGRINNLYVDFGKWRRNPTENDLTDALDLILSGKAIEPKKTRAVGCYIHE